MITEDITLYAKWVSMYPSAYTSEYVDIAKYNNSTSQKDVVVTAVSLANKNYYYFTCYESGVYTIHLNRTVGDFYVSVYNLTENASLIYNYNMYGTYPSISETFFAEAGDVVYLNFYNYGGDYGAECSFYVENAAYPKSTSTAAPDLVERYVYDSNSASTVSQTVTYGSAYSLVIPEKAGSTFVGWYNGSNRVEEGTWLIDSDVTLTPIWE